MNWQICAWLLPAASGRRAFLFAHGEALRATSARRPDRPLILSLSKDAQSGAVGSVASNSRYDCISAHSLELRPMRRKARGQIEASRRARAGRSRI